jgi:hypothetical protein
VVKEPEISLCLFIGGPFDGQWLDINENHPGIEWIYDIPAQKMNIYNEEHYLENGDRYRVFVLEGYDRTKSR